MICQWQVMAHQDPLQEAQAQAQAQEAQALQALQEPQALEGECAARALGTTTTATMATEVMVEVFTEVLAYRVLQRRFLR